MADCSCFKNGPPEFQELDWCNIDFSGLCKSDPCMPKTGKTEYKEAFKVWSLGKYKEVSLNPNKRSLDDLNTTKKNDTAYAFSRGNRFNIPPGSDCAPPPERFRFTTTYQTDFVDLTGERCAPKTQKFPGVLELDPPTLPCQCLCPFTTDTTYAQAYDVSQPCFGQNCAPVCGSMNMSQGNKCQDGGQCAEIRIKFINAPANKPPPLHKRNLVVPGTDTVDCPRCPEKLICPEDAEIKKLCDIGCAVYPCRLHSGAATPSRKYPILFNTPRYVPDPRTPPPRPRLTCHGGTVDCPCQSSFPTKAAINQARERLIEKVQAIRCKLPPECVESSYRASFKSPTTRLPTSAPESMKTATDRANAFYDRYGVLPIGVPEYCLTHNGERPPDPLPGCCGVSSYEIDFHWDKNDTDKYFRAKHYKGCEQKPLCKPSINYKDLVKGRTEEADRWGADWQCQGCQEEINLCPPKEELIIS